MGGVSFGERFHMQLTELFACPIQVFIFFLLDRRDSWSQDLAQVGIVRLAAIFPSSSQSA